jgi:acetyl esterase/lipase
VAGAGIRNGIVWDLTVAPRPFFHREEIYVKRIFLLCTFFVCALPSFAARPAEGSPATSEVYALASDGTPLTWTVYAPSGAGPWPAVLVIHGGRFVGGDPEDAGVNGCAQDLANAGFIAFAIDHRLAPPGSIPGQTSSGRFPEQYDDVHLAVQAARNDVRGNGQVGAVGGSSGATHAAWVAATGTPGDDRLDVAVCLSGSYDFSDFSPDPDLEEFIGIVTNYVGVPSTDTAALRAASPAWVLDATIAPLFLADAVGDTVPGAQLDDMVGQLNVHGVINYEARSIPGNLHSFGYWSRVKNDALDFLAAGFASPPPPTPSPSPSASPSPTSTPTPGVTGNTLLNISTRASAGTGQNVLIGGFIVGEGGGPKRVIVRAIGPSLAKSGVTGALADPSLQLFDSTGQVLAANDDWMAGSQGQEIIETTLAPSDPKESAIIASLGPGAYTAAVNGAKGTQNIALIEVFDLDSGTPSQLLNISTRGYVATGEGVMIAGMIIGGTEAETLVFRGLGPSIAAGPPPISEALTDPMLVLVDAQGSTLFSNDDWQDTQAADILDSGLAPSDTREATILISLAPGNYTALLSDTDGAIGVGLLEIYNITNDGELVQR